MKHILIGLVLSVAVMVADPTLAAGPAPVDLGSAAPFAILAGSTITSTGGGAANGDVGLSPATGANVTGLTTLKVNGTMYVVDAVGPAGSVADAARLTTAKGDLTAAYIDARDRIPVPTGPFLNPGSGDIGGLTLVPGLYKFTTTALITGTDVTLTGGPDDVWIFQIGTGLTVGSGIHVILVGGAQARNVFWQVGSSATLGTFCDFKGTILADQSITLNTSCTVEGRALASVAQVTFNGRRIALPAPTAYRVDGTLFLDEDGDAAQDAGEAGIANVTVELLDTNAVVIASEITDTEGRYRSSGLASGTYTVRVVTSFLPADLAANQTFDPDGAMNHQTTVMLSTGQEAATADFGYNWATINDVVNNTGTGAIGDRLWIDADEDGVQDPGEPGLGGVGIELVHLGADGILGTGDDTTNTATTAADGGYIFDGLAAGVYQVTVNGGAAPTGYTATGDPDGVFDNRTTTPVLLAPGDVYVNADFGYKPQAGIGATIGGLVWFDADADRLLNALSTELSGVSVALVRDSNGNGLWETGEPIMATTLTSAGGLYSFTGVPVTDGAGTDDYLIWVNDTGNLLGALTPTYDADGVGTASMSAVVDLTAAGTAVQDFGYTVFSQAAGSGLIGDTTFLDRDANGLAGSGEGLQQVVVELYDSTGTTQMTAMATDENGRYYFGGLAAGTYVVVVMTNTLPWAAGLVTNSADPDGGTASQSTVTLTAGQINLTQDFGYQAVTPSTISGTMWIDLNADGTLDAGETGRLAGVTVVVRGTNGNRVATTVTDVNGDYTFGGLPDGVYQVDVTDSANLLDGWWHSDGTNDGFNNNSQPDPYLVTISGGATDGTADFGYYVAGASLGNRTWRDVNGDGIQDTGEPGLSNVIVRLTIVYPNGTTNVVETVSDANGQYRFGNLLLDENFNTAGWIGDTTRPLFWLSIPQIPIGSFPTPAYAGSSVWLDSGRLGRTDAFPLKGVNLMLLNVDPTLEPVQASFDFGFAPSMTSVRLVSFRGFTRDAAVMLAWETGEESDTAGFFLERRTGGSYERINAELMPAQLFGGDFATYEQADPGARPRGAYVYRLIEQELSGALRYLGPYLVTIDGETLSFDEWSRTMFDPDAVGNLAVTGEQADPDGDGMINMAEFMAGTNPTNQGSALRMRALKSTEGRGIDVQWLSESNRIYSVERSTNFPGGNFEPLIQGVPASPPVNSVIDSTSPSLRQCVYRIRVE